MTQTIIASLARIADFESVPYEVATVDHARWTTGDYIVAKVTGRPTELYQVEDCAGEMIPVQPGTLVIGALGDRAATLEGVGSWHDVVGGKLDAMTSAGLFGAFTSVSRYLPVPMTLDYLGHICREGRRIRMSDFAMRCAPDGFALPTILLVGTSMSAGKSVTGRLVCEVLSGAGLKVIGAKLTGAGRYRDIVGFQRSGAAEVYDFVDVGLPSTVVPEAEFRQAIRPLLHYIDGRGADFLVAEAGASPMEPYNGAVAIEELGDNVRCTILCASDPYAVVGVIDAFGLKPDLVAGPATNTSAAIDLVAKLTGVPAINIVTPGAESDFRDFLSGALDVPLTKACYSTGSGTL